VVDFSTRLLQKVFRGYRGRARFRRLKFKYFELHRQLQRKVQLQNTLLRTRQVRDRIATVIQRRVRGWLWRKLLYLMVRSSTVIQCLARIRRAKRRVETERRRRDGGPEVINMTDGVGKNCKIGDISFNLKVFRCGDNYKLQVNIY